MTQRPIIHWFRQDLRLADHPALTAAAADGAPVVALYVLDDASPGDMAIGGASRWWLSGSLESLGGDIAKAGGRLVLRRGRAREVVPEVAAEAGAKAVYVTRRYESWAVAEDEATKQALEVRGTAMKRFAGSLLFEPEAIRSQSGTPFRVFTPFWKACLAATPPRQPFAPARVTWAEKALTSDELSSWSLRPTRPDWARGIAARWQPGERAARRRLETFLEKDLERYAAMRDRPDESATSGLSPYLHFGEASPNQVWHAALARSAARGKAAPAADKFLSEVGWREFSYHLLADFPELPAKPLRPEFARMPWRTAPADLAAWRQGRTGYPIVDAGMRELWQTGIMHNRVRMVAASFLIKDLMIDWRQGMMWFWDTLVDADEASNSASWQWVAGCGADASPYYRVFNPVLQGRKFDPNGAYVRRYVPELARLPDDYVHAPWEAPEGVLAAAGVKLGESYPRPLVDHGKARLMALAAFERIKKS